MKRLNQKKLLLASVSSDHQKLQSEIIQILFRSTPQAALLALFVASVLTAIFKDAIDSQSLVLWLAMLASSYISRLLFYRRYRQDKSREERYVYWLQIFRFGAFLSGVAWGLSSIFLLKGNPYLHSAYLLSLAGVATAGYNSYVIDKPTGNYYLSPIVVLGILPSFLIQTRFGYVLTIDCLLFIAAVGISAYANGKRTRENLRLRIISSRISDEVNNLAQRQKLHVDNTPLAVIERDNTGRITYWNSAATRMFGYKATEVIGQDTNFLLPDKKTLDNSPEFHLFNVLGISQFQVENRRKDGSIIHCEWYNTVLTNADGETVGVASLVSDETDVVEAQEKVHRMAYYDALTQLPNRRYLIDKLKQAIVASDRTLQYFAVIYLDLDNFKVLNDTKGHGQGDKLLQELAKRLQSHLRETDTVARLGGDEFIVLLENLGDKRNRAEQVTISVTHKIQQDINLPFVVDGADFNCSASIGICLSKGSRDNLDDVLKNADIAMYEAKNSGKNNYQIFNGSLLQKQDKLTVLKNDLAFAINKRQLFLNYQTQVDMSNKVIGVEALMRWRHDKYGLISPAEFIPLAEETGLIHQIGQWALKQACLLLNRWQRIPEFQHLKISVNVSAFQFASPNFVGTVQQILQETRCPAELLILELTESAVLDNVEEVVQKMRALNELGISLSLDDFGVGQSSLSTLKHLPLQELKIDQSFVHDNLGEHDPNQYIVKSIIHLGKMLGLNIVAEGIETEEQASALKAAGCLTLQGFYYSKPSSIEDLEAYLLQDMTAKANK